MNMFVVTIYPFLIEESFLLLSLYQPYYKYYSMAATLRICLSFSTKALSFRAVCILYFICSFRRESAGISSAASNIRAEVVVMGRLPFSISLSTEYPIPILSANFLCEMPRSSNSSFKPHQGELGKTHQRLFPLYICFIDCKDNTLYLVFAIFANALCFFYLLCEMIKRSNL